MTSQPLAALTTMRVGGPAEEILTAHTRQELTEEAIRLWERGDDWLLLGGGSNTIVADEGYPGPVLLVRTSGLSVIDDPELGPGAVRLRVEAGHDWDALVAECVERGWAGIEALSGIPGMAGAAPVQNIGAYGQELSDVLHSIEFLDASTYEPRRMQAAELELSYRDSVIKQGLEGVVLSIDIVLSDAGVGVGEAGPEPMSEPIAYSQLAGALAVELGARVPLRTVRETVLRLRASKGMVLDEADHDSWSAGSFFTNPIVTERFARGLPENAPRFPVAETGPTAAVTTFEELAAGQPLRVPATPPERRVKLSAAWLIEQSGVPRGYRLPGSGASVSTKHTLAITNRGGASASDVGELARFIVQRVQQEFGLVLVPEPNLYGIEL
ncbi:MULTISPECIES: UDP-N-acetylmuramate dehydrogenase [Leucobacter]|uniref:UDP-N-acetylmuramate dehydrogenase n=1 Tax=Leucobacter TaxID=55968 RepID=UPI002103F5A4|nr:UDP-N-acetylmuramate dehydrogenase [Leucobacter aridicollis]UTX53440.1 UDP-N-acetylmuramate dehydrogenase [Leucobacter aridicollis]